MKKAVVVLMMSLVVAGCSPANSEKSVAKAQATLQQPKAEVKLLSPEEFAEKLKTPNVQLVDVRTAGEVATGKIAKATNIDYNSDSFDELAAKLDPSKPVMVYCKVGGRSTRAVKVFQELGFKEIYELEGGIISWNASKLPLEK